MTSTRPSLIHMTYLYNNHFVQLAGVVCFVFVRSIRHQGRRRDATELLTF